MTLQLFPKAFRRETVRGDTLEFDVFVGFPWGSRGVCLQKGGELARGLL